MGIEFCYEGILETITHLAGDNTKANQYSKSLLVGVIFTSFRCPEVIIYLIGKCGLNMSRWLNTDLFQ
jgi:hypothetical protein